MSVCLVGMRAQSQTYRQTTAIPRWKDDDLMEILKHVLQHHSMPPGREGDERDALAAEIIYARTTQAGHHSVHISMLGGILFCDLLCRKNGEN